MDVISKLGELITFGYLNRNNYHLKIDKNEKNDQ